MSAAMLRRGTELQFNCCESLSCETCGVENGPTSAASTSVNHVARFVGERECRAHGKTKRSSIQAMAHPEIERIKPWSSNTFICRCSSRSPLPVASGSSFHVCCSRSTSDFNHIGNAYISQCSFRILAAQVHPDVKSIVEQSHSRRLHARLHEHHLSRHQFVVVSEHSGGHRSDEHRLSGRCAVRARRRNESVLSIRLACGCSASVSLWRSARCSAKHGVSTRSSRTSI